MYDRPELADFLAFDNIACNGSDHCEYGFACELASSVLQMRLLD